MIEREGNRIGLTMESVTPKTTTASYVTLATGGATRLPSKEGGNEPNLDANDQ